VKSSRYRPVAPAQQTHHSEPHVLLGVLEWEGRIELPVEDELALKAQGEKRH